MTGTLVLVVGPSGAGKDSVINGAREALKDDERIVFARRTITRPADSTGEAHIETTPDAFAVAKAAGEFSLSWQAHDLDYGISRSVESDLRARRCVVANVSRSVLDDARSRYNALCIVNITAPPEILAERIARRGREDAEAIRKRLERATQYAPVGDDVVTLENVGALEDAVLSFEALLRRFLSGVSA